jgi:hypothetical protein
MNYNNLVKVVSSKSLSGGLSTDETHDKICCAAEVSENKAETFIQNSDPVHFEIKQYC